MEAIEQSQASSLQQQESLTAAAAAPATLADISAECIFCDGNCGRKNPSHLCTGCKSFYYCSRRCQKKHWKRHKARCQAIRSWMEELERLKNPSLHEARHKTPRNSECIICFEDFDEKKLHQQEAHSQKPQHLPDDVIVLETCGHGFCAPCLMRWQREPLAPDAINQCPLCRVEAEDVEERLIQRLQICVWLIQQRGVADPLSQALSERCSQILGTLQTMGDSAVDVRTKLCALLRKAILGQFSKEQCQAFVEEHNKYNEMTGHLDRLLETSVFFQVHGLEEQAEVLLYELSTALHELGFSPKHWRGDATSIAKMIEGFYCMSEKRFHDAIPLFEAVKSELMFGHSFRAVHHNVSSEIFQRSMLGLARCYLMVDRYELAINTANLILPEGRDLPGVYHTKALAYLEMGKINDALLNMNRAVLYEVPWDEDYQAKNLDAYNGILQIARGQGGDTSNDDDDDDDDDSDPSYCGEHDHLVHYPLYIDLVDQDDDDEAEAVD